MLEDVDGLELIRTAIEMDASDIHLTVGQRPYMRCLGKLQAMRSTSLTESFIAGFIARLFNDSQQEKLAADRELDASWTYAGRRFRVHAYYQQGFPAMALRLLPERIPTLTELELPAAWQKMKELDKGLIFVTGRTGSGKSTTLASFIQEFNREKACHIVTLEAPIEYIFKPDKCFISQRELGKDFMSFPAALRGALREMPDILLVGEIRDAVTLQTALTAASTGMLVLATLHSGSAVDTVLRIEGMFPTEQRDSIRALLSEVLTGIFAQQLVPDLTGGRLAVSEVLLAVPAVRSLIRQGKYGQLYSQMMSNQDRGMQTMGTAAKHLLQAGRISSETYARLTAAEHAGGLV